MQKIFTLGIAGAAGTLSRYFIGTWIYQTFGTSFPYSTLAVNVSGCWAIGLLGTIAEKHLAFSDNIRFVILVGFLGAFTTFSSFTFDTWTLLKNGQTFAAGANVLVSFLGCFLGLAIGVWLGRVVG